MSIYIKKTNRNIHKLKSHPIFPLAPLVNSSKTLRTLVYLAIIAVSLWFLWHFLGLSIAIAFKSLIKFLKSLGTLSSERIATGSCCEMFSSWSPDAPPVPELQTEHQAPENSIPKVSWSPEQISMESFKDKGNWEANRWGLFNGQGTATCTWGRSGAVSHRVTLYGQRSI